jgi:hypothetical protein
MNVTTAPGPAIYVTNTSSALFGLCGWTSEDAVCYGTVIPIFVSFLLLVLILARQLMITPQHSAVQTVILPQGLAAVARQLPFLRRRGTQPTDIGR